MSRGPPRPRLSGDTTNVHGHVRPTDAFNTSLTLGHALVVLSVATRLTAIIVAGGDARRIGVVAALRAHSTRDSEFTKRIVTIRDGLRLAIPPVASLHGLRSARAPAYSRNGTNTQVCPGLGVLARPALSRKCHVCAPASVSSWSVHNKIARGLLR